MMIMKVKSKRYYKELSQKDSKSRKLKFQQEWIQLVFVQPHARLLTNSDLKLKQDHKQDPKGFLQDHLPRNH